MASPLALRYRGTGQSKPPSDYVIQRNAQKDADAEDARAEAKRRWDISNDRADRNETIQQADIVRRRSELRRDQIIAQNKVNALAHEAKMKELIQVRESEFLRELHAIDATDFASHNKHLKLMEKYHGIPELSDFGKSDLEAWRGVMKITVQDELVKRKASAEKAAVLEEKRTNKVGDDALKAYTEAHATLSGALKVKQNHEDYGEVPPARLIGEIAGLHTKIKTQGERLRTAKPEYARPVQDQFDDIDRFNKLEVEVATEALRVENDVGVKVRDPKGELVLDSEGQPTRKKVPTNLDSRLHAPRIRLRNAQKVINAPKIANVRTGAMEPNPDYKAPPVADVPTDYEKEAAEYRAANPDKPAPTGAPTAAVVPAQPITSTNIDPKVFAPPVSGPKATPAEIASSAGGSAPSPLYLDVTAKRDAAIAERDKNLLILENAPSRFTTGLQAAGDRALAAGASANELTDQAGDMLSRRASDQSTRLATNLGGQAEYERMLAEQRRAQTTTVAVAPAVAPVVPVAQPVVSVPVPVPVPVSPAYVSESTGAVPVVVPAGPAAIASQSDYDALPPGSEFNFNGRRGRKPAK